MFFNVHTSGINIKLSENNCLSLIQLSVNNIDTCDSIIDTDYWPRRTVDDDKEIY